MTQTNHSSSTSSSSQRNAHDQSDKPKSPAKLDGRSWKYVAKRSVKEFIRNECTDGAAALTYYAILSLFPALIAVFSLVGVIGQEDEAADTILGIIEEVAPGGAAATLSGPIQQLAQAPGAGLALIIGLAVAIWSASKYVAGFSRIMNRIYGIDEGRPFWKLRPLILLVTLIGVASLAIVLVAFVLSGDILRVIGDAIGWGEGVTMAWQIARWPVLVIIIVLLVALLYFATPNVKQPKFRWISPGALLAIVALGIATLGFGIYVDNFASYDQTYGSLAGVVIFLFWLWIANLALLFGAQFDAELERSRQLEGGIPAEDDLKLPPRDTRKITKDDEKYADLRAEGRQIRYDAEDDTSAGGSERT